MEWALTSICKIHLNKIDICDKIETFINFTLTSNTT